MVASPSSCCSTASATPASTWRRRASSTAAGPQHAPQFGHVGVAWLHHSNLGAFVGGDGRPTIPNPHWRASTVSAAHVAAVAAAAGVPCLAQELLQWGVPQTTDCVSVLRRPEDGQASPPMLKRVHPDFGAEMAHFRTLGELHSRP
jgi:hypothetical protein